MAYEISLEGQELNEKLGGGIPEGTLTLIEAPNGLGKSILAQRMTYGLIENGYDVSYVSTELPVSSFMKQMNSVQYNIKEAFVDQRLKFISMFTAMGNIDLTPDLIYKILDGKTFMDSDVVIFDTLSDFLVNKDKEFYDNFSLLKRFKQQVLEDQSLVFCVDPSTINEGIHEMLQNAAEVYIEMSQVEQYGRTVNKLEIKRFNAAEGDLESNLTFKVRPNVGIVVELASG
jgi:flagellar protein FlaH